MPIIYTTTAFCSRFDMGAFPLKKPFEDLMLGTDATEIDDRVPLEEGVDTLIVKKRPSAFAGTHLGGILRAGGIDTLICTGVTMASCVRHTVEDALGEGFRTVIVRECVGDRVPAAIEWNLFDLDMKYCDVEPLDRVLAYLGRAGALRRPLTNRRSAGRMPPEAPSSPRLSRRPACRCVVGFGSRRRGRRGSPGSRRA